MKLLIKRKNRGLDSRSKNWQKYLKILTIIVLINKCCGRNYYLDWWSYKTKSKERRSLIRNSGQAYFQFCWMTRVWSKDNVLNPTPILIIWLTIDVHTYVSLYTATDLSEGTLCMLSKLTKFCYAHTVHTHTHTHANTGSSLDDCIHECPIRP